MQIFNHEIHYLAMCTKLYLLQQVRYKYSKQITINNARLENDGLHINIKAQDKCNQMFKKTKNSNASSNRIECRKRVVYKAVNELLSAGAIMDFDKDRKRNRIFVATEEGIEAIDSIDARDI